MANGVLIPFSISNYPNRYYLRYRERKRRSRIPRWGCDRLRDRLRSAKNPLSQSSIIINNRINGWISYSLFIQNHSMANIINLLNEHLAWGWLKRGRNRDSMARYVTIHILYTLLDAAIHQIPMNEQGRTHDGDFIRGALQRWSKLAERAKDEEKVSERRGKRKRGTRVGRRRDTGKMYAHAHASVAERSRIVLLFNSDRVIDLAQLSRVRTYIHIRTSAKHARVYDHGSSRWRKRESIFARLGARWRGKVSFNDFDMGGRHVPPCNLHYSRDVSALAKHRRDSSGRCRAAEPAAEIPISPNQYLDR